MTRDGMVDVPAGDFPIVQIKFHGDCADAGVTTQYYTPNVGLIRSEETTIAGPVVYRLIKGTVFHKIRTSEDQECAA